MARLVVLMTALALATSCAAEPGPAASEPKGPPEVVRRLVQRHASQFSEEDPQRPAGSQGEEIAATYLLGHLQTSGYVVFLDSVPVSDQVTSTNVVALAPSGRPRVAVVAPYDTAPGAPDGSVALGLLLEAARALNLSEPGHSVSFVALGAERAEASGGGLGSRRLVVFLEERQDAPAVVSLGELTLSDSPLVASGAVRGAALGLGLSPGEAPAGPGTEAFGTAGLETGLLAGSVRDAAKVLLRFLAAEGV